MRATGERSASGAWLRTALLVLAVAIVLVLPLSSPGSGTAVNLDSSGDVAALVRADHHAKTLPSVLAVAIVLLVAAAAVRLVRQATVPVLAIGRTAIVARRGAVERLADTGVLACATVARRGPPALR